MLKIDIQNKRYSNKTILKDVKVDVLENGLYGIVGKNGSGKTTFFNCLTHLTTFQGTIHFNGKPLPPSQVAFIPTEPFLYDYLSVEEFTSFYCQLMKIKGNKNVTFDVDTKLLVKELSTGMRKKAYINAVFQKDYDIYIFDEPYSGLDIESVYVLRKIIKQLSENHIVFVSSHLLESLYESKAIYVLQNEHFQKILPKDFPKIETMLFE
ncbi:ATP-binding cassette domain-containing protein [Capnocytophaga canimorsus]|uniref:ATP-binding cassette domain-containing protein n=1 Tax=Capnocytophaga canimorsus TaxID=28188 RepID=UPI0037CE7AEE